MTQAEVGRRFSVTSFTICNWEKEKTVPQISQIPELIKFLGYDPTSTIPNTIFLGNYYSNEESKGGLKKWLLRILVLILVLGLAGSVVELF